MQETIEQPTPARAICQATGLTLGQLSDELGVSVSTAQSWSIGRLEMSDRVLRRIAAHFGIELKPLLERGVCLMRCDGLPLTPQRWAMHRDHLEHFATRIESQVAEVVPERTELHAELSIALRRAAERGETLSTCSEILAFLRST